MIDSIKIAKALSDPIRHQIMMMLVHGDATCCKENSEDGRHVGLCNCEIMTRLDLIQSRVSYHMKELVDAGLVTEEPRGKWKHYFINAKTISAYIEQLNQDFAKR